jgi:uncharacterized protein involved in exopolysaccharide biosynthesis
VTGAAGEGAGQSPTFFANLLTTTSVLERVVAASYDVPDRVGQRADLVAIQRGASGTQTPVDTAIAIRQLRGLIDVINQRATGLVEFSVTTQSQRLSYQIAATLIQQLNEYNIEARRNSAAAERNFMEQVRNTSAAELAAAENDLRHFLESNRNTNNSPALTFEHDRLARRVSLAQQLFGTLAQAADQARIDAIRDTPSLTVVEAPRIPALPNSRHTAAYMAGLSLVLAGAFGGMAFLLQPPRDTNLTSARALADAAYDG